MTRQYTTIQILVILVVLFVVLGVITWHYPSLNINPKSKSKSTTIFLIHKLTKIALYFIWLIGGSITAVALDFIAHWFAFDAFLWIPFEIVLITSLAQYHSTESNALHKLADLICAYEKKDWESYFAQVPLAEDYFMPERLNFNAKIPFKKMGAASGKLSNTPINKDIDEDYSCQSSIDEENTD